MPQLPDDFRKLADAHLQKRELAAKNRKERAVKWEEAKRVLKGVCDQVTQAAGEYKQQGFSAGFGCLNGECILMMSLQGGPSHELKFRLDLDKGAIAITDTTGGVDHFLDLEPLDQAAIEDRVARFQEAFFKSLEQQLTEQ